MKSHKTPLISIITITYNSVNDLIKTIGSIEIQSYSNYELIIIDGNSNDGTKIFLSDLFNPKFKYISEPDKGIYDAMNKGLDLVTGDFVLMLNSGDTFTNQNSLYSFVNQDIDLNQIYFTKALVIDEIGNSYFKPKSAKNNITTIKDFPIHQAIFVPKKFHNLRYNINYSITGDTEYLIRLFKLQPPFFLNIELVNFHLGGVSSHQKNYKQLFTYITELNNVVKLYENPSWIKILRINCLIIIKFILINYLSKSIYYKCLFYFNERN